MRLIKLYQPNCAPCSMVDGLLTMAGVSFESIDVQERPEVASKYEIMAVPVTILLDDNDEVVAKTIGFKPEELEALIARL